MSTEKYEPTREEVKKAEEMIGGPTFERLLSENRQDALRTGYVYLGHEGSKSRWVMLNADGKLRLFEGSFINDDEAKELDVGVAGLEVELEDALEKINREIQGKELKIRQLQSDIEVLCGDKDVIEFGKTKIK